MAKTTPLPQDLLNYQIALVSATNQCNDPRVKEQLDLIIKAVNEVNAQYINNAILSALLTGDTLKTLPTEKLKSAITELTNGLIYQNAKLQELSKLLPTQLFISGKQVAGVDTDVAIKALSALTGTLDTLTKENMKLKGELQAKTRTEQDIPLRHEPRTSGRRRIK